METYDHIEIPKIEPDVTRVVLHGGVCQCCAETFKAEPPQGLEPGSPFGQELRAYVIYLLSVQEIPLARLSALLKDLFGLEISEGALVNISKSARASFAEQADRFKVDLKRDFVVASDETGLRVGRKAEAFGAFIAEHMAFMDPHKHIEETSLTALKPPG